MSIELRLSDVQPPEPEPPRTIYRDYAELPDPTELGLHIYYYNHDNVDLYFQITGSASGYTFNTVNLGLLSAGGSAISVLDDFASRAKPSNELVESITLILKAYTDANYTNLKWTYQRDTDIVWINSNDSSYTVDVLNNFDDGTVQGWASEILGDSRGTVSNAVANDYVLSTPYSLKTGRTFYGDVTGCTNYALGVRTKKAFTTSNKSIIYAIMNLRFWCGSQQGNVHLKHLDIKKGDLLLVRYGGGYFSAASDDRPREKWMRIVIPLSKNETFEFRIENWARFHRGTNAPLWEENMMFMWMDDFKIISK